MGDLAVKRLLQTIVAAVNRTKLRRSVTILLAVAAGAFGFVKAMSAEDFAASQPTLAKPLGIG